MSGDVFKPLKLQAARNLALCLLLVPFAARAIIGTPYQMQLGKGIERPSEAAAVDMTFKKTPKAEAKGHEQTGLKL